MPSNQTKVTEKEIIHDYKDLGMTQNEISRKYNINVTNIRRVLRANGLDTRMNSKTHDDVDAKILEEILAYKKISEISKELGVTRDVVRRVANNNNIDVVQYRNAYYSELVIEMINDGRTYVDIIKELGVSLDFIKRTIQNGSIDTPMEKKEKQVLELYGKGYGIVRISKELKMSTRTVHKILDKK